jgi:ribosomal protein S4E
VYPRIGGEKYRVAQNRRGKMQCNPEKEEKNSVPQNRRKKIQCTPE